MANNLQPKRPQIIDFDFIHALDGGALLCGYVPNPENSNSGVIIATGFDLGARNDSDLRMIGLNATFIGKLYPYLGRQGMDAYNYITEFPLNISVHEAAALDSGFKQQMLERLLERYNSDSSILFGDIPQCWQTVIASLEFQYDHVSKRFPIFWKRVTKQQWDEALLELRGLGGKYNTRRNKEADYILANS